jgi:hypothetical protein
MKLLDRLPWVWVALIAAWLAVAPVFPEPHLVEKIRMLRTGTLVNGIDIFDLVLHAAPLFLLLAKSIRWFAQRRAESGH